MSRSVITVADRDALRNLADNIRQAAEDTYYGYYPGGDPREFFPDHEMCSEDEMEAHRKACAEWDAGEGSDVGPPCTVEEVEWKGKPVTAFATRARYGIGTYTVRDKDLVALAQQLDDWLDAAGRVGL